MTTHDESITTETKDNARGLAEAAEKLVSTLFGVGRLWAAHGLGVGRSALEASAQTLRATAEVLGEVSSKLEDREEKTAG